jgi:hypothetical protein
LKAIQEKIHGVSDHERIRVKLVDFTPENVLKTKDSKLIYATFAYESQLKAKGSASL